MSGAAQQASASPDPFTHGETVELTSNLLGALSPTELKYAPPVLHLDGDETLLSSEFLRVAIVGSRKASPEGERRGKRLAKLLVQEGVVVVSGLAEGIDFSAHMGALNSGGKTIAVLGTPLSKCYPAKHRSLQEHLAQEHLVVSQFENGHRTRPSDFVKRNRTMALLSHASVIVEANDGSGTLSQAAETVRLGRPLFIMRSVLERADLEWPRRFIDQGARVLDDVADLLGELRQNQPKLSSR